MLDEWLIKYVETFGENFPVMCMMGTPEEEMIAIIKDCIRTGKPYKLEWDFSKGLA